MTAARFDMYTLVHKGQRRRLFELTAAAGQLDAADHQGRASLASELEQFAAALEEHGEMEDRFLIPLHHEANPHTALRLCEGHGALHEHIAATKTAMAKALSDASAASDLLLYRALARLTSNYLAHIEIEEAAMPELWARYDDATLAATQGKIVAAHRPETVTHNLRAMLPAASRSERIRFLTGMRKNLPPAAFSQLRENVNALLPAEEWAAIEAA